MEQRFQTSSLPNKNRNILLQVWLTLAILSLLGILISVPVFLYFEALLAFSFLLSLFLVSKTRWILVFENDKLTVINTGNRLRYFSETLTRSDFSITQTAAQRAKNRGDLKITGCPARLYDVQNIEELQVYLYQNFKDQ